MSNTAHTASNTIHCNIGLMLNNELIIVCSTDIITARIISTGIIGKSTVSGRSQIRNIPYQTAIKIIRQEKCPSPITYSNGHIASGIIRQFNNNCSIFTLNDSIDVNLHIRIGAGNSFCQISCS